MLIYRAFAVALLLGTLQACQSVQDVKDALEGRTPEAENTEVGYSKGPPLSIPPDYSLRPPVGGGSATDNKATSQVARTRVFNLPASPAGNAAAQPAQGPTAGERAFVKKLEAASGGPADPQIRQKVAQETQVSGEQEKQMTDKLLTWREAPASKNTQAGQGVTEKPAEENTNVVIRKRRGLLDSIF